MSWVRWLPPDSGCPSQQANEGELSVTLGVSWSKRGPTPEVPGGLVTPLERPQKLSGVVFGDLILVAAVKHLGRVGREQVRDRLFSRMASHTLIMSRSMSDGQKRASSWNDRG
jgi:hypothetical protein